MNDFDYTRYEETKRKALNEYHTKRSTIIKKNCVRCDKVFTTDELSNYPMCYTCFLKWQKDGISSQLPKNECYLFIDDDE